MFATLSMARTAAREGSHEQVAQMISARRRGGGGATHRPDRHGTLGSASGHRFAGEGGGEGRGRGLGGVASAEEKAAPRREEERKERRGKEKNREERKTKEGDKTKTGDETGEAWPPGASTPTIPSLASLATHPIFRFSHLLSSFLSFFFLHMRSRNLFEFNANTHRQQQISQGPKSHRLNFVTYRQVSFFFEFFIHFDDYSQMSFSQVTSDHLSSESTESFLFYCFWLTSNNKSDE